MVLFFFYLLEGIDTENAQRAKVLKQTFESVFAGTWELKNRKRPVWAHGAGGLTSRVSVQVERTRVYVSAWREVASGIRTRV